MTSNLLKSVRSHKKLEVAWKAIYSNRISSTSKDIQKELQNFSLNPTSRIRSISTKLSKNSFVFDKSKGIRAPKKDDKGKKTGGFRPIVLSTIDSSIVQRTMLDIISDDKRVISYIDKKNSFGGLRIISSDQSNSPIIRALEELIKEKNSGKNYILCSDIKSFFTRISKDIVIKKLKSILLDEEFCNFLKKSLEIDLINLEELGDDASKFPIDDLGVPQGNSLSPFMGNIILKDFDQDMNSCNSTRCIRYIDDFIIISSSEEECRKHFDLAQEKLSLLGMSLSENKTSEKILDIRKDKIVFLGIEFFNGYIRPDQKSKENLLKKIRDLCNNSIKSISLFEKKRNYELFKEKSLIYTLIKCNNIMEGWIKYYSFCNDKGSISGLRDKILNIISSYLRDYRKITQKENQNIPQFLGLMDILITYEKCVSVKNTLKW